MQTAFDIPWFLYLCTGLGGLVVGSFLNVVVSRLPKMMTRAWRQECCEFLEQQPPNDAPLNLAFPGSHCPNCGEAIKPWHNIPLLSYVALGGQCAACKASISWRYPMVEAVTALLWVAAAASFGPTTALLGALLLIAALIALTGIDLDTQLLPDSITLPLLWLGLLFNISGVFVSLEQAVIGAMAGYLVLWSVYWLFKIVTGKEGMGYGDFKLLAALGAWFGWQSLPLIIILSSFVGAAVGIFLIIVKQQGRDIPIPFGPYLAGAGLLCLFFQTELTHLYLALVGFN